MAVASIGVSVTARVSRFLRGMKMVRNSLGRFGKQVGIARAAMSRLASGMVIAGGGIAFGMFKALQAGERFNKSMTESQAIMTELTQVMRKDMAKASIEMARVSLFSSAEVAKAFFFLTSAGLDAKRSLAALPVVVKFAQAGMFDLSLATQLLTDAQSAMGLKVKDATQNMMNMTRVSDVLVRANQLADATTQEFSEALTNKAAAAARFLGIRVEEVVATLAVFADRGLKGRDAGRAFSIVTRDLTTKLIRNRDAFRELGIRVFTAQGALRPLPSIIRNITQRLASLSVEAKKEKILELGFTDRSSNFLMNLLGSGDKMAELMRGLLVASGTTAVVASKQMTVWDTAVASMEATWTSFGSKFKPVTEGIAQSIKFLADTIQSDFLDKLSQGDVAGIFSGALRGFGQTAAAIRLGAARLAQTTGTGFDAVKFLPGVRTFFPDFVERIDRMQAVNAQLVKESQENLNRITVGKKTNLAGEEFAFAAFERKRAERLTAQQQAVTNEMTARLVNQLDTSLSKLLKVEDASSVKILVGILAVLKAGTLGVPIPRAQ